jgi:hypothetical protein
MSPQLARSGGSLRCRNMSAVGGKADYVPLAEGCALVAVSRFGAVRANGWLDPECQAMPQPLALTDAELEVVMAAASVLPPGHRTERPHHHIGNGAADGGYPPAGWRGPGSDFDARVPRWPRGVLLFARNPLMQFMPYRRGFAAMCLICLGHIQL